ncbi:exosortase/archaeosortase family protein [Dysgonomonas sp. 511]|uniref:exosortase/archaeosortase family protein n=1 Tax=Dysgonomonas sp. 511 TaxID=2302930 RepID=UPI0013D81ED1|nr:exosortase/archaeosortase family protein [Dysgonomonas sp. 511]NDV79043.1 exosortase/archaeosortase family protein [Dysgonomonas sp. 511]
MNTIGQNKRNKLLLPDRIKPFKGIIWFLCLFVIFEFIWKLIVHQGGDERIFLVCGKDLTAYTAGLCQWTASSVYWVIHDLMGYHNFHITNGSTLHFEGSVYINIIWTCTGIKQVLMFSFIIACYFGPTKKKYWYIPLSALILIIINILRLVLIFIIIKEPFPEWFIPFNEWYNGCLWDNTPSTYWQFYSDWFNLFHRDIFKWIYYDGIIFILWLIWEEKIRKPERKLSPANNENQPQQQH